MAHKVCPVVTRKSSGVAELLAYDHRFAQPSLPGFKDLCAMALIARALISLKAR